MSAPNPERPPYAWKASQKLVSVLVSLAIFGSGISAQSRVKIMLGFRALDLVSSGLSLLGFVGRCRDGLSRQVLRCLSVFSHDI